MLNNQEIYFLCSNFFILIFIIGWSQTMLTFAPELPSHVMEILKPYFTFVQVNKTDTIIQVIRYYCFDFKLLFFFVFRTKTLKVMMQIQVIIL